MNLINYRDEFLTLRDGIKLQSRIWIPEGEGPWPALLMRQPYGKQIASTVTYAHPMWWASNGFLVVIQDVRGQSSSGGYFNGFDQEASDTTETHFWIRNLPECNGKIGTYGFSYQGLTQLLAEPETPPPDCMAPAMTGLNEGSHWSSEGGAFWWQIGIGWGLQLAAQKLHRESNWVGWHEIRESLDTESYLTKGYELLKKYDPKGMAMNWIKASNDSSQFFKKHEPLKTWLQKPMLLIGGWWDPHLKGILNIYEKSIKAGGNPDLIVGPATHLQWWQDIQKTQLDFFRFHLINNDENSQFKRKILWNLTTKKWMNLRQRKEMPIWNLIGNGISCLDSEDGLLVENGEGKGIENIVHDPWRPAPAIGGHLLAKSGEVDRSSIDKRSDVATFTSRQFKREFDIEGIPILSLIAQCDQNSFDLTVALSILPKDSIITKQLSTGILRITGGKAKEPLTRRISLQPMLATFKKGERIRISIAGAAWPAIGVNPGTGVDLPRSPSPNCLVTTISLVLTNSKLQFSPIIPI